MNIYTEHTLQCNQSEPLTHASGRIVDLMNENDLSAAFQSNIWRWALWICKAMLLPVGGRDLGGCGLFHFRKMSYIASVIELLFFWV